MAAAQRNKGHDAKLSHNTYTPVLIYENNIFTACGAYIEGREQRSAVLTAGHIFDSASTPSIYSYRFIDSPHGTMAGFIASVRPLSQETRFGADFKDVAVCGVGKPVPLLGVQLKTSGMDATKLPIQKVVRCTSLLSGDCAIALLCSAEDVAQHSKYAFVFANKICGQGESGTTFVVDDDTIIVAVQGGDNPMMDLMSYDSEVLRSWLREHSDNKSTRTYDYIFSGPIFSDKRLARWKLEAFTD